MTALTQERFAKIAAAVDRERETDTPVLMTVGEMDALLSAARAGRAGGGGVALIAAERERQVSGERWTPEHDDEHAHDEMALAAVCYALPEGHRMMFREWRQPPRDPGFWVQRPAVWPWDADWWKPDPNDRVRELVKAGALIAAEIDRLQRSAGQRSVEASDAMPDPRPAARRAEIYKGTDR